MPVPEEAPREAAERPHYSLPAEQVLSIFGTGPAGLSASQARERLEQYGPNELIPTKKISPWIIFYRQFQNLKWLMGRYYFPWGEEMNIRRFLPLI